VESVVQSSVHAVILTWNDFENTKECVYSVLSLDYEPLHVNIIDNGSKQIYTEQINEEFSELENVSIHTLNENLGFSGGMNYGIQRCLDKAHYIWILNNDVIVPSDFNLVEILDEYENIKSPGLLSPEVLIPNSHETWLETTSINYFTGKIGHSETNEQGLIQPDYVPLCSAIIRENVIRDLGKIPENYFLYYEDVDYSLECDSEGFSNYIDRNQYVFHHGERSTGGEIQCYYTTRNHIYFIRKNSDKFYTTAYIYYLIKFLIKFMYYVITGKFKSATASVQGLFDAIRGRKGKGPYP